MLNLNDLIGKKVTAIGSCGMGKGVEVTGILDKAYNVIVTEEDGWEMPYSVYRQTIKEVKEEK